MSEYPDRYYENFLSRSRKERFVDYAIGASFIMLMFAVALFIVPLVPVALRESPIDLGEIDISTRTDNVCPGDVIEFTSKSKLREPSIVDINVAIVNTDTSDIVEGTRQNMGPIPRNLAGSYEESIEFVVPNVPPGNYARIAGLSSHNSDTNPIFVVVPFTVSEDCQVK